MDAIKRSHIDPKCESWYSKLMPVLNNLLIQAILLQFEYQSKSGKKVLYTSDAVASLLERIPTQSWSDGTYHQYPLPQLSVHQWQSRLQINESIPAHIFSSSQLEDPRRAEEKQLEEDIIKVENDPREMNLNELNEVVLQERKKHGKDRDNLLQNLLNADILFSKVN